MLGIEFRVLAFIYLCSYRGYHANSHAAASNSVAVAIAIANRPYPPERL